MTAAECVARDTLKQYLAGWVEEPQAALIERHLEQCESCERTVVELEGTPDTIFQPLRRTGPTRDSNPSPDVALHDALVRSARLLEPRDGAAGREAAGRDAAVGRSAVGPYDLLRRLGRGGMGAVYLARHRLLDKQVALKLLPAAWTASEEAVGRFRREVLAVGKLNHPAIVSATDAGEQEGVHFLVMEFVDGVDLSRLTRHLGPLRIPDACELVRQVALGLAYAHAAGIVHRDIKPSNVMLNRAGQAKVLDFGLAQFNVWDEASAELTSVGQLMGTLDYMAPEQAERPSGVDYRADLYALGATLFRLLTGRAPLAATPSLSPLDKLRLLAEHSPPRLDTLRADAPPELVQLVATLLARRPESRPASAAHVAEQLAPWCAGADLVALTSQACAAHDATLEDGETPEQRSQLAQRGMVARGAPSVPPRRWPWSPWLAAAGLLAVFLAVGVAIMLETRKGVLVIESEVPGVRIKVLQGGQTVDDLRLEVGATSTRLAADRYELLLESPSDSITLDRNEFVLKNRGTVVARVRQQEVGQAPPSAPATQTGRGTPLYDGKPLDAWLDQLARERSPKAIGEALQAIEAMVQARTMERIRDALVQILPTLDGQMTIPTEAGGSSSVDLKAFWILRKTNAPRDHFELMANLLDRADANWGKRILTASLRSGAQEPDEEMEPLLRWIEAALRSPERRAPLGELIVPAAWVIRHRLNAGTSESRGAAPLERRFLPLLRAAPELTAEFWLAMKPHPEWSFAYRQEVCEKALAVLSEPASSSRYAIQAAVILTEALEQADQPVTLDSAPIAAAVRARLAACLADAGRVWQTTEVESSFASETVPRSAYVALSTKQRNSRASEVVECLDLIAALKSTGEADFDLQPVLEATRSAYLKVAEVFPDLSRFSRGAPRPLLQTTWPEFDSFSGFRPGSFDKLTSQSWLGFLIFARASEVAGLALPSLPPRGEPGGTPNSTFNTSPSAKAAEKQ